MFDPINPYLPTMKQELERLRYQGAFMCLAMVGVFDLVGFPGELKTSDQGHHKFSSMRLLRFMMDIQAFSITDD